MEQVLQPFLGPTGISQQRSSAQEAAFGPGHTPANDAPSNTLVHLPQQPQQQTLLPTAANPGEAEAGVASFLAGAPLRQGIWALGATLLEHVLSDAACTGDVPGLAAAVLELADLLSGALGSQLSSLLLRCMQCMQCTGDGLAGRLYEMCVRPFGPISFHFGDVMAILHLRWLLRGQLTGCMWLLADGWAPTVQCSLKLAELHLLRATSLSEGQGSQAKLSPTCQHHLQSCDRFLTSVQLSFFAKEHMPLQQPSPHSGSSAPDDAVDMDHDHTPPDHSADSARAVVLANQDHSAGQAAGRYHWTRGSMAQLQKDQEEALEHLTVCEELCKQ